MIIHAAAPGGGGGTQILVLYTCVTNPFQDKHPLNENFTQFLHPILLLNNIFGENV